MWTGSNRNTSEMKKSRILMIGIGFVVVGIQFVPTTRNTSNTTPPQDFVLIYKPTEEVANILHQACYNCHSNNTDYPWYNKVQPVSWYLEHHIKEAKEKLNFNEFGDLSDRQKKSRLKGIVDELKHDDMPLTSYKLMHPEARLDQKQIDQMIRYFKNLESKYS